MPTPNRFIFKPVNPIVYPLDGVAGIEALYSFRRLTAAYSGAVIRARRASDDAELDFTPSGKSILTFTTVNAWAGGDAFAVKFYDQSGNGRDAVQATAANQPKIVDAANGIALQFDGTNDTLKTASFTVAQPVSFDILYKRITNTAGGAATNYVFAGATSDNVSFFGLPQYGFDNVMFAGASSIGDSTLTDMPLGTRGAVSGCYNGASTLEEINSAAIVSFTGSTATNGVDGISFGADWSGALPSNMELQEFLLFSTAQISATLKARNAEMLLSWGGLPSEVVTTGTATGGIWAGAGTITDSVGAVWSIRLSDRTVLKNGVAQAFTNVLELWYADASVFAFYGDHWQVISGTSVADRPKMPSTPGLRMSVGPQTLSLPAGVTVNPGDNLQALVTANPAGTVFCLRKGTYNLQSITPKAGNQFIGEHDGTTGVTFNGGGSTQYAFYVSLGINYVVIKNIFVTNYTAPTQTCAIMVVGAYGLVDHCDVANGTLGGGIWGSTKSLVVGCKMHANAQLGYKVVGDDTTGTTVCVGCCFDSNEINGNNPTDGIWGGSEQGGGKAWNTYHLTFWYNYSHGNFGSGMWTDFNNIYTDYWYNQCDGNSGNGIEHEISYNARFYGNSFSENGSLASSGAFISGCGIAIENAGGIASGAYAGTIEIAYNTFSGGSNIYSRQIGFREQDRGTPTTPYSPNAWRCENTYVHDNVIVFGPMNDTQVGLSRDHDLGTDIYALRNIKFDYNAYTFGAHVFFAWQDNAFNSYATWQGYGQDVHSTP